MDYLIRGTPPAWATHGSGFGYGDYGYGDYGYGYGDGFGYGNGSGDNGNGSGDGSGFGYGDGAYWAAAITVVAASWTDAQRARMAALRARGAKIAYWRSDQYGQPMIGRSFDRGVQVGDVTKLRARKSELCTEKALHATMLPPQWPGARLWIVALIGDVVGNDYQYGALRREVLGEVTP